MIPSDFFVTGSALVGDWQRSCDCLRDFEVKDDSK
jgi:hypothetical protein